jgi:hypothetical protein
MAITQTQQAVVDFLVAERQPKAEAVVAPSHRGWVSTVGGGRKLGADPSTVRIRRSRDFGGSELHCVTFSTPDGLSMMSLVRTLMEESGSIAVYPMGGGGDDVFRRDLPWVNFAAQWTSTTFRGGGRVIGNGADDVHVVRIRFANGTIAEDAVDSGIVLFEALGPITFPAEIEFLDRGGARIHSYTEFNWIGPA